jgi:hypothetical protein
LNSNKEIQNLVFFNKPKNIVDKTRPAQKSKKPEETKGEMKIIGASLIRKK